MSQSGEIVSLHLGQAGCQLGNSCWEMYCLEHNIRQDGIICDDSQKCAPSVFFNSTGSNKVVPRALFIDLEPSVIGKLAYKILDTKNTYLKDEIRTGSFRLLFNPHNLITGKEDAANCFARGYFTLGREITDLLLHRLRFAAEECNHLQGFFIFRAYGGGTGSGLTASLLESLEVEFPKSKKMEFSVYPAPKLSSIIVEPYNAALATHLSLEHSAGCFLVDNEACYDICDRLLDVCSPTFKNINRLMGQIISAVTASLRFGGEVNVDLGEIQTNLIPYPRIQYPLISYAPLMSKKQVIYENTTVNSLLDSCFEPSHQIVKCDTRKGKYIACTILFRGDVTSSSVNAAINSIKSKKTGNFVNWCPTGFKVGINSKPPIKVPGGDLCASDKSCLMLANSTAVRNAWEKVTKKFDLMFEKKAFLHWYISEGLEEADFQDTRLDLEALDADYREVEAT